MSYIGTILKMRSKLSEPVKYNLPIGANFVEMNSLLGKEINISWTGEIYCVKCGKKTKQSFFQGFCYNCFSSAPEAAPCILKPELCDAHLGIARDMKWAEENCLKDHYVYLSITAGVKVGVTRCSQVPTRWIDQGAVKAVKIAKTPNRHLAGLIEIDLKQYFSDRTAFQKMLKNHIDENIDLYKEIQNAKELLRSDLRDFVLKGNEITEIKYPVLKYPKAIKSISLEKEKKIRAVLSGIKGQYLIFEDDKVMNIRKHGGYKISFEV